MDRPLRIYLWLAFGITWGAGGLALLIGGIRSGAAHPLHHLAAFGPSIAGFVTAASVEGWAGVRRPRARLIPTRAGVPCSAIHSVALAGLGQTCRLQTQGCARSPAAKLSFAPGLDSYGPSGRNH
jgi:hypothetical protein